MKTLRPDNKKFETKVNRLEKRLFWALVIIAYVISMIVMFYKVLVVS